MTILEPRWRLREQRPSSVISSPVTVQEPCPRRIKEEAGRALPVSECANVAERETYRCKSGKGSNALVALGRYGSGFFTCTACGTKKGTPRLCRSCRSQMRVTISVTGSAAKRAGRPPPFVPPRHPALPFALFQQSISGPSRRRSLHLQLNTRGERYALTAHIVAAKRDACDSDLHAKFFPWNATVGSGIAGLNGCRTTLVYRRICERNG